VSASALAPEQLIAAILRGLREDATALAAAEGALTAELERRGIRFGEGLLPTYAVPFFAPAAAHDAWNRSGEALAAAVEEVAQQALRDPAMARALRLRPDAQAWVDIDPGYPAISVLARPDAVLCADGGVRYVEYNSDSPAMMAFSDHVAECLLGLPHLRAHAARLRAERMLPLLHETLLGCYRAFGGGGSPTIAIVDWPGQKTRFEHARIAEYFEAKGCPTVVCDPRSLSRPGRRLEHDGRPIDLVYRRALFTELLDHQREVEPLISAYRDGAVCMVNPLRSYLASSKTLLAFLCANWPAARGVCPVIPTRLLDSTRRAALRERDQEVVLKKGESHGGLHVLLPGLTTPEQRRSALDDAEREPWVDQDYLPLPRLEVPCGTTPAAQKYYNWNPFLFGGRYAGAIARASDTPLINITLGGGLLPTLRVEPGTSEGIG
jgi:glutathionylspermidine synthase